MKVYLNNVNGLACRADSVKDIIESEKPDVVVFCETKASNSFVANFFQNIGYVPAIKNRISASSGGIVVAVRKSLSHCFTESTCSLNDNICAAVLKSDGQSLKIIAAYGPQETEKKEDRQAFYDELAIEVVSGDEQGYLPLILGDLNAKIAKNSEGNSEPLSSNGELLTTFINDHNLVPVNHLEKCSGKWTRQHRSNADEKSVLDYMLLHESMTDNVSEVVIDEELFFTPYNVTKKKGGALSVKYTDHNAMVMLMVDLFKKPKFVAEKSVGWWKLSDEGLKKFNIMTDHYNAVPYDNSKDVQENFDIMSSHLEIAMLECFKKVHPSSKHRHDTNNNNNKVRRTRKILQEIAKEGKAQRKVAHHYLKLLNDKIVENVHKKKAARISDVAISLTEEDQFSTDKFWQLNKSRNNKKCAKNSVISGKNVELFNDAAILKEYEKEFQSRLSLREIDDSLKDFEERSNSLLKLIIEEGYQNPDEPDFTREELDLAIQSLNNGSPGEDLLHAKVVKASGSGFRNSFLKLVNQMKNSRENGPQQLDDVMITALHKKGSKKHLVNKRGIFLTSVLAKVIEKLIKARINPNKKKVNPLQFGSTKNKSPADSTFILRGVLNHARYVKKPVYLLAYDFTQCFDSLWLEDCLLSLWDLGVSNQLIGMMFKMNQYANVTVNTPHGPTEKFGVERIVKQGTVLGPDLCSCSTAEMACENVGGVGVGTFNVGALLYVDDMILLCTDDVEATETHLKAIGFSCKKRLKFSHKKCFLLIAFKKKHNVVPALEIDGSPVSVTSTVKVLGDWFNEKGNNKDLINDRVERGNACIVNSMSLCNELSLGRYTLITLIVLYGSVFLQSVLFNSQAWSDIKNTELERLQVLQLKYLKRSVKVPSSCPNAGTFLEFGVLPIEGVIHCRQLCFLHHILTLEASDPVYRMYVELKSFEHETNWANDVKELLIRYNITSDEQVIKLMSKDKWKSLISTSVQSVWYDSLIRECAGMKKTQKLCYLWHSFVHEMQT